MTLDEVLVTITERHWPNPPASMNNIDETEGRLGFRLPNDMCLFYLRMNGASLFSGRNAPFRILRLNELRRARVAIFGCDSSEYGPASWIVFCALPDTNFVAIDLASNPDMAYRVRDCSHSGFPNEEYCDIIANGFTCFVSDVLNSDGNVLFWLRRQEDGPAH